MLEFLDPISSLIDQGLPADIIYVDFHKAFCKTPHEQLMLKIEAHGIVGRVSGWIGDWLPEGRQQCVVLNGSNSEWADV